MCIHLTGGRPISDKRVFSIVDPEGIMSCQSRSTIPPESHIGESLDEAGQVFAVRKLEAAAELIGGCMKSENECLFRCWMSNALLFHFALY